MEIVDKNLDKTIILDNINTITETIKKLLNDNMLIKIDNNNLIKEIEKYKNEIKQKDKQIEFIIQKTQLLKNLLNDKKFYTLLIYCINVFLVKNNNEIQTNSIRVPGPKYFIKLINFLFGHNIFKSDKCLLVTFVLFK